MINEDLLLSRIDILENKLLCYQKNVTDEKLQNEVVKLQDDKTNYQVSNAIDQPVFKHIYSIDSIIFSVSKQITAKEALKKVYQERMSLQQKFTKSEQTTQNCEQELAVLRSQLENSKQKYVELTQKLSEMEGERDELIGQCRQRAEKMEDLCQQLDKQEVEMNRRLKELQVHNEELQGKMRLIENTNVDDEDDSSDTNKNLTSSWNNKSAIIDLFKNSDLRKLNESDDIINAICNVNAVSVFDLVDIGIPPIYNFINDRIHSHISTMYLYFQDVKNGSDTKIDLQKCSSQLAEKLLDIEKKYLDNKTNSGEPQELPFK